MTISEGIILGAVQGATEFLPVSSSGHLIAVREVFGIATEYGLGVDAMLQLATILAVGIYFRADLWNMAVTAWRILRRKPVSPQDRVQTIAVILGTIPAVLLGLALEDLMESTFRSVWVVVGTLVLGAILIAIAERAGKRNATLTVRSGFIIGCFQALALIPGMSRSGSTISGGLLMGLTREAAARFSFLLAFPVIAGSGMKKMIDLSAVNAFSDMGTAIIWGFLTAFAVGMGAIHILLSFVRNHSLMVFVWYRVALAAVLAIIITM